MREDDDHCDGSIREDSNVTIALQCSMRALLGISYPNRHA